MKLILRIISALLISLFMVNLTEAGVTGKISGMIVDASSGTPLVGVTVMVVGTDIVTQTDIDGEYYIINIPSGKYEIAVSSVGYETVKKNEVRVLVDLTTPVDFELNVKTHQLNTELVVVAENPIIQKDLTSSRVIFTAERLQSIPNITSIQSILTNYPGVIVDKENDMHVRGGRTGQVAYYFDGFSIHDPFYATSGIRIIPNSLEELTLTSSGFTAEYGDALSGVISAVSKEGTSDLNGFVRVYEGFTHTYDVYNADWSNLKKIDNKSASVQLSGPIPIQNFGSSRFSITGEYLHDPTSLPHNGSVSYTATSKLSLQPIQKIRLISNFTYHKSFGEIYEHRDVNGRSYDFNLDGLPSFKREAYLLGISGNYHINKDFILSTKFNRFYTETKQAPEHLMDKYWTEWPGYSEDSLGNYNGSIHEDNYLGSNVFDYSNEANIIGFTLGSDFDPTYRYRESEYNAFHINMVNQINKYNQIKTGLEYRYYKISWDNKQFYNLNPYGEKYSSKPVYFSMYLQDKMEYEFFIINLGLRYDFRHDDIKYNSTPLELTSTYVSAESVSNLSPRLGISFPITEKSVMHFNYGVYYQVPQFLYMYTNLDGDISSGYPLLGNPNLTPERTSSYELGLDHLIGDNLRIDLTAYYKDIDDLVATVNMYKLADLNITTFENTDYGSVKGFDFSFERLAGSGLWSVSVAYSYMISKGISSNAFEGYYTFLTAISDTLAPVNEFPLDYDQRHTLTAYFDLKIPFDRKIYFKGVKIPSGWGLSFVGYYGSGMPYTKTDRDGHRLGGRNQARLPSNYVVDMRFNKDFRFGKDNYKLSFFVEVDNLFNKRNILNVYTLTGTAENDGFNSLGTSVLNQEALNYYDKLYDHDPQNYSNPRTVRTGLQFNF